jgi:hypothetical protein
MRRPRLPHASACRRRFPRPSAITGRLLNCFWAIMLAAIGARPDALRRNQETDARRSPPSSSASGILPSLCSFL